jgi:hypothetical protein
MCLQRTAAVGGLARLSDFVYAACLKHKMLRTLYPKHPWQFTHNATFFMLICEATVVAVCLVPLLMLASTRHTSRTDTFDFISKIALEPAPKPFFPYGSASPGSKRLEDVFLHDFWL